METFDKLNDNGLFSRAQLEKKVDDYKKKLINQFNSIDNKLVENKLNALRGRQEAEKRFPEIMKNINLKIEEANGRLRRKIEYRIQYGILNHTGTTNLLNSCTGLFLFNMIFQALVLQGFELSADLQYDETAIEISW